MDSFAGGGGASTGIEMALGRSPDIAINHDAVALAMHEANHPATVHLTSDIWSVDPVSACGGRPVGLLWASPDCKHFSKAKGGKPVEKNIRGLAWVVVHWANTVAPRVIILENVEEFQTWGPLGDDGRPCAARKGLIFKRWVGELERLGYAVEWRELRACDYGAPTIRKRLFLIARRDGEPIVWPAPTHGAPESEGVRSGSLKPWRTAAEIIDWSLPCPSIFDSAVEIMVKHGLRAQRPLQPATLARIAKGVKRYVLDAAKPFIVNLTHHGEGQMQDVVDPLATVTAAHRGEKAMVMPFVSAAQHGGKVRDAGDPLHTVAASPKDQNQIIAAHLTKFRENSVGASLEDPAPTITANSFIKRPGGAAPIGLVAPVLTSYYGAGEGDDVRAASPGEPLRTQTTGNRHAVVAPHLMTMRHADKPFNEADRPSHTITSGGAHMHLVAAFLAQNNYQEPGHDARTPLSTVVAKGSTQAVVSAGIVNLKGSDRRGRDVAEPAPTQCAGGEHIATSTAFVVKYYGADQDPKIDDPLHTVTSKARFGLAEVLASIPPFGPEHVAKARRVADLLRSFGLWDEREFVTLTIAGIEVVISDLGLRMFVPPELFRAQGFPDSYIIDRDAAGRPITKTQQVAKCGNSVCPPMAAALVRANYAPREVEQFMEAAE
nr:DNA cytosine methyltransferase [Rhodopseudomonas infernalis]